MDNYFVRLLVTTITGVFGGHYYLSHNVGKGILYSVTFGFLGIGYVIDLFRALFSSYNVFCPPHILMEKMREKELIYGAYNRLDYYKSPIDEYPQNQINANKTNVIQNVNINVDPEILKALIAEKTRGNNNIKINGRDELARLVEVSEDKGENKIGYNSNDSLEAIKKLNNIKEKPLVSSASSENGVEKKPDVKRKKSIFDEY